MSIWWAASIFYPWVIVGVMGLGVSDRGLAEFEREVLMAVRSVDGIEVRSFEVDVFPINIDIYAAYFSGDMDRIWEVYDRIDDEFSRSLIYDREEKRVQWGDSVKLDSGGYRNIPSEDQSTIRLYIEDDLENYAGLTFPRVDVEFV